MTETAQTIVRKTTIGKKTGNCCSQEFSRHNTNNTSSYHMNSTSSGSLLLRDRCCAAVNFNDAFLLAENSTVNNKDHLQGTGTTDDDDSLVTVPEEASLQQIRSSSSSAAYFSADPAGDDDCRNKILYSSDDEELEELLQRELIWRSLCRGDLRRLSGIAALTYRVMTVLDNFHASLISWSHGYLRRRKGLRQGRRRVVQEGTVGDVVRLALLSRVVVLFLQVVANVSLRPFLAHENDGFKFEDNKGNHSDRIGDVFVRSVFGGFMNWDGHYFMHIAVLGYSQENMLAFFPLFPKTLSLLAMPCSLIFNNLVSFSSLVLAVGWVVNTLLFVGAAVNLFEILTLSNFYLSKMTVIWYFCFNPASIFFSALYTESMFAFLTLQIILSIYKGKIVSAYFWASLSCLCRANGILNFGLVGAYCIQRSFMEIRSFYPFVRTSIASFLPVIPGLAPFLLYQIYGILKFCTSLKHDDFRPPYCDLKTLPYSYVQQTYWNVGFLRYFEFKQIPNFILATPCLVVLLRSNCDKLLDSAAEIVGRRSFNKIFACLVAVYGLFLAFFCLFFIHVQVSTRFIMASFPFIYMNMTELSNFENEIPRTSVTGLLRLWCVGYLFIGTIAFTLGYPWT